MSNLRCSENMNIQNRLRLVDGIRLSEYRYIQPSQPRMNRTPDGRLGCAFGTLWEHHFDGTGCPPCDAYTAGQLLLPL